MYLELVWVAGPSDVARSRTARGTSNGERRTGRVAVAEVMVLLDEEEES